MKNIFLIILCIEVFATYKINGQSTLINALPLEYNPSFAGSAGNARIAGSGYIDKQKFYGLPNLNNYSTRTSSSTGISYDQFFSKLHMGIGITFNYSKNNLYEISQNYYHHNLNSDKLVGGMALSPKFSIKGKYTLAPSFQGLYGSNENYDDGKHSGSFLKFKLGILFNTQKFYMGYTVDILNNLYGATKYDYAYDVPSYDSSWSYTLMIANSYKIIRKGVYKTQFNSNFQFGYSFQRPLSKLSFTPQLVIYLRENVPSESLRGKIVDNSVINLSFRYNRFLSGVISGNGRLGLMVGYQNKNIKLMYALYRINGLNGQISLRYTFNSKAENKVPAINY